MLKPIGDKILVKPIIAEKSSGGLFLPDTSSGPKLAEVVRLGDGILLQNGETKRFHVKIGDKILLTPYSGGEIELEGVKYKLVTEEEIAGIIE